jgi:hypothetical protein
VNLDLKNVRNDAALVRFDAGITVPFGMATAYFMMPGTRLHPLEPTFVVFPQFATFRAVVAIV